MNVDNIIKKLQDEYTENIDLVNRAEKALKELQPLTRREDIEPVLEELQEACNKLCNIKYTDTILELQVIINEYRHKFDITDPREVINWDNGKGFVQ